MVDNRPPVDEVYLRMAETWALRSYATRSKVGALLVLERQIISDGYNGMPSGLPNDEIEYTDAEGKIHTNPLVIHAEANVFDKLSRNGTAQGAEGATLYLTLTPCIECAKRIINNKIARVVYRDVYRDASPLELLKKAGIELVHRPRGDPDVERVE